MGKDDDVFLIRVSIPDRPGSLGAVASAMGTVGADIHAVEIVGREMGRVIDDFLVKLPKVKPWIIRDDDQSVIDREYLQTPEELEEYQQFSNCINCMLCYAACPVYGLDPDFIGPAAIALAERYDLDTRDRGRRERLDILIEREGVWGCTFVGECTRVCPKHVDPAGAIQRYKLEAAKESVMAFLLPRGVL